MIVVYLCWSFYQSGDTWSGTHEPADGSTTLAQQFWETQGYWAGLSQLECMFAVENTEVLFKRILLQHEQRGYDMTELLLSHTSEIFPCSVMTGFPTALLCWKADMHLKWGEMFALWCCCCFLLSVLKEIWLLPTPCNLFCCKLFMF